MDIGGDTGRENGVGRGGVALSESLAKGGCGNIFVQVREEVEGGSAG